MSEENEAIARRVYEGFWNEGNMDVLEEVYAPDVDNHELPLGMPEGVEGTKACLGMFRSAFPDTQMTIEDQIAEGNRSYLSALHLLAHLIIYRQAVAC